MQTLGILVPALVLAAQGSRPPALRPLADILGTVSANVKEVQDTLPDFLCTEKVTSTTFRSGKIRDRKIVESLFSIQKSREHREILAIDGKPAKKNANMPGLPVNIRGAFNLIVIVTLSPRWAQSHDFAQRPEEAGRIVLDYETKKDQKDSVWDIAGDNKVARDTGRIWIDPISTQVARVERNLLNIGSFTAWKNTIEQAPFRFGDRQFWLPKSNLWEITWKDSRDTGTFLAEYSNCKKFTAEVTIRSQE